MSDDLGPAGPPPTPLAPQHPHTPFLDSIDKAGIDAGLDAAREHEARKELVFGASTAQGGTVKLSFAGRWKHFKAALFGQYTHDTGFGAGIDGAYQFGDDPAAPTAAPTAPATPDPRFPQ